MPVAYIDTPYDSGYTREKHTDPEYAGQTVNVRKWQWAARTKLAQAVMYGDARVRGAGTSSMKGDNHFSGCSPMDALARARDGWPEGVGKLNAALDSLAPKQIDGDAHAMDVNGFAVCIGAYVAGDPECMYAMLEQPDAKPVISLFYQCSYSHGVSVQNTENYAAALTSLVGDLDAMGITTGIYAAAAHYQHAYVDELDMTVIREPGAPLDLSKVAFSMSAPMHRRIQFALWEGLPGISSHMHSGAYGYNCDLASEKGVFAREIIMANYPTAIFLPWIGTLTSMGSYEKTPQEFLDAMRAVVLASVAMPG